MTGTDLLSLLRREVKFLDDAIEAVYVHKTGTSTSMPRTWELLRKAADEIERLRAENEAARDLNTYQAQRMADLHLDAIDVEVGPGYLVSRTTEVVDPMDVGDGAEPPLEYPQPHEHTLSRLAIAIEEADAVVSLPAGTAVNVLKVGPSYSVVRLTTAVQLGVLNGCLIPIESDS